ncbi:DEAD/DEAH box helicase [Rhizobium leguminosarum]|uniref:DEAD/DEAH box helicase n=1 Tax=Rhizobium leguminosarum TaxID=384 RepID=UPI000FF84F5E|nr:DEAD/DEAH box helicase [Rhizobium leguminosarum]RWY80466.1 DEAD/DEAH box helicase [Rhizobium leguminosarum]
MKPFHTLSDIRRRSAEAIVAQSGVRNVALADHMRRMFCSDASDAGALLQQPIIEGSHPYVTAEKTMAEVDASVLHPRFVSMLDEIAQSNDYRFPKSRRPFAHQLKAWEHLAGAAAPQSVLVTSGTGSGKTECFLFPILSDLVRQLDTTSTALEGVQAIMLYPLNALIESQQERLSTWTAPFDGKLRYCLYNGNLPPSEKNSVRRETPEKLRDREQLRGSPPPVLVTNITMLEYMLARTEDQPIIEKSKGKLKWIVLDEAHSLVGAAAAEIALLLRRVLLAFECKPEDVHFVATSATIGSGNDVQSQLKRFLADVAGIEHANVHVVEGHRQLPGRPSKRGRITDVDALFDARPEDRYEALAADDRVWSFVSDRLFKEPLTLAEFERSAQSLGLDAERYLMLLSSAVRPHPLSKEDEERLAPVRVHSFERAVPGLWTCVNDGCLASPDGWSFGAVYLDRCDSCPTCSAPVLEIVSCSECGEVLLEAVELPNDRIRGTRRDLGKDEFEAEATRDDDGTGDDVDDEADGANKELVEDLVGTEILIGAAAGPEFRPLYLSRSEWRIEAIKSPESVSLYSALKQDSCPCCQTNATRGVDRLLRPIRFGAPFMIASAAPILLEGVDAEVAREVSPSQGRRVLSFTDSRQGTARMSAKIQAEAERNFVRSFVYHTVQHSLQTRSAVDTSEIERTIASLEPVVATTNDPYLRDLLDKQRNALAEASKPSMGGVAWDDMVTRLSQRKEVGEWVKEVWEPRDPELFHDSRKLADFLLLREFARRPRTALSLESLGLARLRFAAIDNQTVVPPAFVRYGKGTEDWRAFLYAITTFFLRANAAVAIDKGVMHWITPKAKIRPIRAPGRTTDGERRFLGWPGIPKNASNPSTPQMLLMNGLGLDRSRPDHRADFEEIFERAWHHLQTVLNNDLDHPALDLRKAYIAPLSDGYFCALTRRIVDIAPFGASPLVRASRHSARRGAEPRKMPTLPSILLGDADFEEGRRMLREWLDNSEEVKGLRADGAWNNISDRVALFADYSRSAEHSAQQDASLLQHYESQFKAGRINILNCSTTMEMGVDIGSVSTVLMTNVPPSIANYKQRVGRAGRRRQPFSLAFTFCRDRPLDREAFNSPERYLARTLAAPKVALSSRPIVQRHVNAFLLRRFMLARGGNAIKMEIGAFMGTPAVVGESRPLAELRPIAAFREWLAHPSTANAVGKELSSLVRHSVLEGQSDLVERCREIAMLLETNFVNEWTGLQVLARDEGIKDAAKGRMALELKRLCQEFLLSALADRGFLPGHGFPTGVVTFVPHKPKSTEPQDGRRTTRLVGPQRSLDLAIRDYAPGSEIVLDGLVHKSAGVLLNWKRPASEENVREVQSLKFHWVCQSCGTSDTGREFVTECPVCAGAVRNDQYLRPAGFSVDAREKAHAETDIISYVPPEEPSVSVRASAWASLPVPDLGRSRSTREGSVYYSNRGQSKNGYALCLHCGRAAPDHEKLENGDPDPDLRSPLESHLPLRWKKGESRLFCEGNDSSWAIKRNLELGYEITTDVFELQPSAPLTRAAATALVIALREGIARDLGIEADEMGFATQSWEGTLAQRVRSMLVFDRAAGGAGFCTAIPARLPTVLREARSVLNCPNPGCKTGCAACVLVSDAPFEEGRLDRTEALDFLDTHLSFNDDLPDDERFGVDPVLSTSALDEVNRILVDSARPVVHIFLPEATDPGQLSEWASLTQFAKWHSQGYEIRFVVSDAALRDYDGARKLALYNLGQRFSRSGGAFPILSGVPATGANGAIVGIAVTSGTRTTAWASIDLSSWLPGAKWGEPATRPVVKATVSWAPSFSSLESKVLLPSATSRYEQIEGELDRTLTLFGSGMASRIRSLLEELGIPKTTGIESIVYSDLYVKSPLVAKMFVDTVAALTKGAAPRPVVELLTGDQAGNKPGMQNSVSNDWRDSAVAEAVLKEYAKKKDVDLCVTFKRVAHGRYMNLRFEGGKTAKIVFDQGFGAWKTVGNGATSTRFEFRDSPMRQAESMGRCSAMVSKTGLGPTYLVASID